MCKLENRDLISNFYKKALDKQILEKYFYVAHILLSAICIHCFQKDLIDHN